MKRFLWYIGIAAFWSLMISNSAFANHESQSVFGVLSSPFVNATYCNQSASASATFQDEPNKLLYWFTAGGTVKRDDVWAAHLTKSVQVTNFSPISYDQELYRFGNCQCGQACPGEDNISWLPLFQDTGDHSIDSITLTGEALEKFKPQRGSSATGGSFQSVVGFDGYQYQVIWRLCHQKQITYDGECKDISGNISVDKSSCGSPCAIQLSWNSTFATNVQVYKNGAPWPFGNTSSGSNLSDYLSDPGTYNYELKGKDGFGTEYVLGSTQVKVSRNEPPVCSPASQSANLNSPVTINATKGDGNFSWSALGGTPSSGTGSQFITSYSTAATHTVTVTSAGQSTSCTVNVSQQPIADTIDIKANSSDNPITINAGQSFTLSWGPQSGGSTANYSNCNISVSSSFDKTGGPVANSGSTLKPTASNEPSNIRTYFISCTNLLGSQTSDSISVSVSGSGSSAESCSLDVSPNTITQGNTAYWSIFSSPSGYHYDWHGTDNGKDIGTVSGSNTNSIERYTYNQAADYFRYVTVNLPGGVCRAPRSGSLRLSVESTGGTGGGGGGGGGTGGGGTGGGGGGGTLSCSAPGDTTVPYQTRASVVNGKTGFGYNWGVPGGCNITGREVNDGSGGSNHWIELNCGGTEGNYNLVVTEAATSKSAQCIFSACPVGGCAPEEPAPPPSQDVVLKAATTGQSDFTGNWQTSLSGTLSLQNVDLWAAPGTQQIYASVAGYNFDCTNDGTTEATLPAIPWWRGGNGQTTAIDLCNYNSPGSYTASAAALGDAFGVSNGFCWWGLSQLGSAAFCREIGRGTVAIQVNPPPQNFNFDDILWSIQSGTTRYRVDYDYDNSSVLDKGDLDILLQVAIGGRRCPGNKTCDVNGSGSVNAGDASAYSTYLKTYEVQAGGATSRANVYLSSPSGATVAISSNAPSGSSISPTSVTIPQNGQRSAELRVPLTSQGTYTIVVTGIAGGGTTKTSSQLTLRVASAPVAPASTPDFGLNSSRDIFLSIIGTGRSTSNTSKITVSSFAGFNSKVNLSVLSVSPALSGATYNFTDSSLNSSQYLSGSDFSVTVPASTPPGVYTITVRGSDGGLVRDLNLRLNVNTKDPSFREI